MAFSLRNPRIIILILAVLGLVCYMFATRSVPTTFYEMDDPGLAKRVQKAERMYQKVVKGREELIRKFGPAPQQVVMFPQDKEPWPAYTAWDFFPPAFNCPHERERVGALGDGGKWVCGLSRLEEKPDCVVYSFGIDWSSTFEAEILSQTKHCQIWGYDSSAKSFGWQINKKLRRRTHFKQIELSSKDSHDRGDTPKMWTLKSLMEANGHTHIDILRVDLEGREFDVIPALLGPYLKNDTPLPFGQLQIEFHTWNRKFLELLALWEKVEAAGLRPFMKEANLIYTNYNRAKDQDLTEYSFLNIRGSNIFVTDPSPFNVHGERPSLD